MNLSEYLVLRANGRQGLNALTRKEALIIGLKYPLRSGWARKNGNIPISEHQKALLDKELEQFRKTKKERREARNIERYAKALKYGWQPTTEPVSKPKRQKTYQVKNKPELDFKKYFVASDSFLNSFEWRKVRMMAIKKYGAKCMCCGATPDTGAVINVDHIKPRKLWPSLALDINNLQILCHDCNHGKGNWDTTDWRK